MSEQDCMWYVVKHRGTLPGYQIWEGHPMPSVSSPEDDAFIGYYPDREVAERVASKHNALTRERDELRAALREANGFRVLAEVLRYGLDGANDVIALADAFREDFDTLTNKAAGGKEA